MISYSYSIYCEVLDMYGIVIHVLYPIAYLMPTELVNKMAIMIVLKYSRY